MKRIFFTAALMTIAFTAAVAQNRSSKTENDAAMKAGRITLATKATTLEADITNHNYQAAKSVATEVLALMHKGMAQVQTEIRMQNPAQQATLSHYNDLEHIANDFNTHFKDVTANGNLLVTEAKAFLNKY